MLLYLKTFSVLSSSGKKFSVDIQLCPSMGWPFAQPIPLPSSSFLGAFPGLTCLFTRCCCLAWFGQIAFKAHCKAGLQNKSAWILLTPGHPSLSSEEPQEATLLLSLKDGLSYFPLRASVCSLCFLPSNPATRLILSVLTSLLEN